MFDDSAARVDEFLSAQHTIEATTTKLQMISHHYSTSTGTMTGERNADANARGKFWKIDLPPSQCSN
jgi:hypothetical protein